MKRILLPFILLTTALPVMAWRPYDVIEKAYAPYMDPADPLAFPMKVRSLSENPYTFWRGSKDLFFIWCKTHAGDWLADREAYLPNHGDLHLGNIGSYASFDGLGMLAFGMVDFDDSAELPFQSEILQGVITLHLIARQNGIELTDARRKELSRVLREAYHTAVNSRRNTTDLLADEPMVREMLARKNRPYAETLADYTEAGRFKSIVRTKKGKLREIFRPVKNRETFARAIAEAVANSPEMAEVFRHSDVTEIQKSIRDIGQRTRLGSSGSQGLKKYFVLMDSPLRDMKGDAILYLKQEIPAAAERSGFVSPDPRPAGQRAAEHMLKLTDPIPYLNSWCSIGNESYWVTFKEPWSDEIDYEETRTFEELLRMGALWATVAGATHREEGRFNAILPRLTDELMATIDQRAEAYGAQLEKDFAAFRDDERVKEKTSAADAAMRTFER